MSGQRPAPGYPFAAARFDFTAALPALADLGHTHLLGIGGAGMSALARLLRARGVPVSGSDAKDSPVLAELRALGVEVQVGHDARQVAHADTVVISSAVREANPELSAARAAGLRVLHRAQALRVALGESRLIAVAGANGKTTTTSLIVEALQRAGADPTFAIGGELATAGTSAALGTGDIAVVEADESDGSFLVYRPDVAVVTSVQPDHLDFYGDFAAVQAAYAAFAETLRPGGLLIACVDDPGAAALAERARRAGTRVLGYGEDPRADLRLTDLVLDGLTGRARLLHDDAAVTLRLGIPGAHNLANAAAAYGACVLGAGAAPEPVLAGLAEFAGTRRRFEIVGTAGGVSVVDDYGHNVGKVTAVVRAAAGYASDRGGRLVVVFQPHLYSRTRDFAAGFGVALAPADEIVVLDVYAAREDPEPGVTGALIADAVRAARPDARVVFEPDPGAAVSRVLAILRPGDVALTLGAGDVTALAPRLVQELTAR